MRREREKKRRKKKKYIYIERIANTLQRRFAFNVLIAPKTSIFQYPGPTKRCSTNALLGFIIRSCIKANVKSGDTP